MPIIKINSEGYVSSPYIKDANIDLEISDIELIKISRFPAYHNWRYLNKEFILEPLMDDESLKGRRTFECFNIIDNRSVMWYNHLTDEQKQELEEWYQAWLHVTETKIIPEKPEWLE